MVLDRNIFCNRQELEEYSRYSWLLDELTGEAHPIQHLKIDKETGEYKIIKFNDGYKCQDTDYLRPTNVHIYKGMNHSIQDKPYQLIFSGQYVKIINYNFLNDFSTRFSDVSLIGITERLGYSYDIEVITPEEYFINTSENYRELHPELKKKYYIGC